MKIFKYVLIFFLLLIPSLTFISLGQRDSDLEMDIYLVSNDIHIGIALPVTNEIYDWKPFIINEYFNEYFNNQNNAEWIEFGWGDRQFYFDMPTWD